MSRLACLAAALAIAACAPAGTTDPDDVPAPAGGSATAAVPVEGGGCNVETGQPGPGEGAYERAEDGELVCVSQEPGMERPSVDPRDLGTGASER